MLGKSGSHRMRDAMLLVQGIEPAPGSIFGGGCVNQRSRIEPGGVADQRVMESDSFRLRLAPHLHKQRQLDVEIR